MVDDPASTDARSDVFLLGAVLHEVLTGRVLHTGRSLPEVLYRVLQIQPRTRAEYPDTAPASLVDLCLRATHPDRASRPASVDAFRAALLEYGAHCVSDELAASALAKLDEAERRLAASADALGDADTSALLAEGRFGFEQSLQQWSSNEAARRGLRRCLEHACRRELRLRNLPAARALLHALAGAGPELAGEVERLERELEAARAVDARHAALAQELEASVSAVPRLIFQAGLLVVGTGASLGAYLEEQRTGETMSTAAQAQLDRTVLGFLTVGLLVGRRWLLTNAFHRSSWALWFVATVAITTSDLYLATLGVDAAAATPVGFGILATVFTVGAVTVSPRLGFVAAPVWATALLSSWFPPSRRCSGRWACSPPWW